MLFLLYYVIINIKLNLSLEGDQRMTTQQWFWLAVVAALLVGGLCLAHWYAKRQKAQAERPVRSSGLSTPPSGFVPSEPYAGLPHVWTFINGDRVYTDMEIDEFGSRRVRLRNGTVVTDSADVHLSEERRDWAIFVVDRFGRHRVRIDKHGTVVNGNFMVG